MNFFKKVVKEINVFALIIVIFALLIGYRQLTHVELSDITDAKLVEKINSKDSFVILVGNDSDNTTLGYKSLCNQYLENNRKQKIYYLDIADQNNPVEYIQKTFNTDDGTSPCMIVIEKGNVIKQKSDLSYYRISELFK